MIEALLSSYPRRRPELPKAYQDIYEREYKLNREGDAAMEGIAKKLEGWMHTRIASRPGGTVLELGGGTLNHVPLETQVDSYDVVEPFTALYADSPRRSQVRAFYDSIHDIPDHNTYSRIISVATLEHIEDLPRELARAGFLLEQDGLFQAGIPSEGGFLWWLGWRMTTGISFYLRNRLDYGIMMRHEHVNTATDIIALLRHLFRDVSVQRFPVPSHQLSLYCYIEARNPDVNLCESLLADRGHGG